MSSVVSSEFFSFSLSLIFFLAQLFTELVCVHSPKVQEKDSRRIIYGGRSVYAFVLWVSYS